MADSIGNCDLPDCALWQGHEQDGRTPCEGLDGRLLWDNDKCTSPTWDNMLGPIEEGDLTR